MSNNNIKIIYVFQQLLLLVIESLKIKHENAEFNYSKIKVLKKLILTCGL